MGNACSTNQTCQWNSTKAAVVPFEADPDIAGIGVIAAFLISAWLTFFIVLFTWNLVDGVMEEDRLGVVTVDWKLRSSVLKRVHGTAVGNALSYVRNRVTREQMQEVCLMFSDQQLITGAAILIVGYVKHCEITQYHFYIAANLTLMSFATYQSVLLIVHDVLQANIRRGWRTAWSAILYGSVLTVKVPIYNDNFLEAKRFGLSMDCFWRQLPNGFPPPTIPYVVFSIVVDLLSGYFILYCLYPEIRNSKIARGYERAILKLISQPTYLYLRVKRHLGRPSKTRWLWKLIEWPTWLLFFVSFTLREICLSIYFDLARIFMYLFQTTYSVLLARDVATANGREGQEDSWGFGQILPLLLLALPLFSLLEAVYGQSTSTRLPLTFPEGGIHRIMLILTLEGTRSSAPSHNNAQHAIHIGAINIAGTTSASEAEMCEEKLYDKKGFLLWMVMVLSSLFGLIVFLSLTLNNGVPF